MGTAPQRTASSCFSLTSHIVLACVTLYCLSLDGEDRAVAVLRIGGGIQGSATLDSIVDGST